MIDLNIIFETSLTQLDYDYLARFQGLEKREIKILKAGENNKEDYLNERSKALELLQSEEALNYAFASLLARLSREGYCYVEIAFTPTLHTKSGLNVEDVIKIAYKAIEKGMDDYYINANLLIYTQRSAGLEINREVANLAIKYHHRSIAAFGIESDTKAVPYARYMKIFSKLKKNEMPLILEADNRTYNSKDIDRLINYGAKRIVGLYKFELNYYDFQKYNDQKVVFEYHPIHDLITEKIENIEELSLKQYWIQGFNGYIAGGSHYVSDSSLTKEFKLLVKDNLFYRLDVKTSMQYSLDALFLKPHLKGRIINRMVKDFDNYYKKII